MQFKSQVGRPHELTQEVYDRIIENVQHGLRPETIANLSRVAPSTLRLWLKTGAENLEDKKESIFAQFLLDFNLKKAEKIKQWLDDIGNRLPNWQASWELARAVAREDFGVEATEYKELLEIINNLSQSFKKFQDNPLQGEQGHGSQTKEMDSECD